MTVLRISLRLPRSRALPSPRAARWRRAAATAAFLLLSASLSATQFTGAIDGTVTDAAGGALPGAVVTVAGPEGRQESVTGSGGEFAFAVLPAGDYVVAAALPGFGPSEIAVAVPAGETVTVPFVL